MTQAPIRTLGREAQTPAEELRRTLDQLGSALGKLGYPDQQRPIGILRLLDHAAELLEILTRAGADLAPERGRFETATRQLRRKQRVFLTQIGGESALQALRIERKPPAEAWWWHLDQDMAVEGRQARSRAVRSAALVIAVIAIVSGLYAVLLAPNKATRLRYRHEQAAEAALSEGDLAHALVEVNGALGYAPEDGNLLVLKAVILDSLGGAGAAAEGASREARGAYDTLEEFLATRIGAFLLAGRPERALADARELVTLDPNSALGAYLMGNANTALGNLQEADENYAKAAQLAAASDQAELQAMARAQQANLQLLLSGTGLTTPPQLVP